MKITSKSILSPNHHHHRDSTTTLSSLPPSLSRRLKTNRSLRGAQSPMFPTAGNKKPRSTFDNPEPSSPKVTCIGQVRVKTKKKKQGSKKHSGIKTGEVSFRKIEGNVNPNQKWVHLPLTICEALRGFGAEFSCLFPCRPSCFSTGGTGGRLKEGRGNSSCVAVFGRWLVGVQGREIELVVGGGGGEEREAEGGEREKFEVNEEIIEEERRVSICVPPKNALLLMRCRSDPIRVSALVNRFWESPIRSAEEAEEQEDKEGDEEDGERLMEDKKVEAFRKLLFAEVEKDENPEAKVDDLAMEGQEEAEERENPEGEAVQDSAVEVQEEAEEREGAEGEVHGLVMEVQEAAEDGENPEENSEISEEIEEGYEESDELEPVVAQAVRVSSEAEENKVRCSVFEAFSDLQRLGNEETVENPVEASQSMEVDSEKIMSLDEDLFLGLQEMFSEEEEAETVEETEEVSMLEKETKLKEERGEGKETQVESEAMEAEEIETKGNGNPEREGELKKEQENRGGERSSLLPECLLLMMCEPKLSMEVSKETWVCSGDFIRWQPERRKVKKRTDGCEGPRVRVSIDSTTTAGPAPAVSMAALIEQKLVNAAAYEPFVLTRCKSEPLRTAAGKLAPETCFWKNRKLERLEPHRRATFGVGF